MANRLLTAAVALSIALAFGAGSALGASVNVHGKCEDGSGNGGGGSVGADSDGNTDLVDADETQSIAEGLAVFAQGTADDASQGNPGEDACHADDNTDDDDHEENEDHLAGSASAGGESVGFCYDNEGFHQTADCHGGPHTLP